jgi:hypothetical protein
VGGASGLIFEPLFVYWKTNNEVRMNFRISKIGGCVILGISLLAATAWWWLFTIPFPQSTLQKLTPGMSQAQVYSLLGPATETNQVRDEALWIYSHSPCVRYLLIEFDSTGKYKSHVID